MTPEELRLAADPAETAMVHSVGGAPAVIGTVIHGDRRGRELGFPTANLALADGDRIEDGVWAADVYVGNTRHIAAASVGRRPTFYDADGVRLLEPFLLDFDGDLYGKTIVVHLRERIRPQRRFESLVALIQQMRRDVEEVRRWAQTARSLPLRSRATLPAGTR
ncbi:riboflavin kinase [Microbacterium aquimaris]|uniref:riboflavin kinase n=1 Tax=Microbacterium aquimaris TaxID=459816 RepID=UPI002AD4A4A8|nr:riboflavin kinase [Microbacterium aquimaris]MDZ8274893.1 riboflavin kinase [Microbacterium aquimaris]